MRISVVAPFQLVLDGKRHTAETGALDVPEELATQWIAWGWAEPAPPSKRPARGKG